MPFGAIASGRQKLSLGEIGAVKVVVAVAVWAALLFGHPGLLLYAAAGWVVTASFVHWYEEPTLSRRFGAAYDTYRRAVPAWLPRRSAWDPGMDTTRG